MEDLKKEIKTQLNRIAKVTSKIETTNNPVGYKPTNLYKPVYDDVVEQLLKRIRQREKDLLARVREVVGENEVCPCEKLDCPIRRINQFREELIKKLEIISEEGK